MGGLFMSPTLKVWDSGFVDGGVSRVVCDGKRVWVESFGASGWSEDPAVEVGEVAMAPPVSEAKLSLFGCDPADVEPIPASERLSPS